jgi:cobalt-zinc-cadmium efflux system outer membrane protein
MQLGGRDSQYFTLLSQEIVTKHKLQLNRAAACREVAQAELQFVRTRFDLLTAVRQSFYVALAAQQRLEAVESLMQVVRRSTKAAQDLEDSGEGARGDTLLLELELERTDFTLQNAAASLKAAQRKLAAVLGDPDLVLQQLDGDLAAALPDYPYQLTQSGVLTRNSLVQAADIEVEKNRILLQRATVEPFPNVTVQGGYMSQVMAPHDLAIVQLAMPIPVWNKNQGNIQAARANINRASHTSRKTQVDLIRQLAAATGRFDVARQQTAKYEKSILPKAKESVQITRKGFDTGHFDLLRVLQSQRMLIESELNYLAAQEARWSAAAEIAGLLQEEEFPRDESADGE